jgi:hypothetical protein
MLLADVLRFAIDRAENGYRVQMRAGANARGTQGYAVGR